MRHWKYTLIEVPERVSWIAYVKDDVINFNFHRRLFYFDDEEDNYDYLEGEDLLKKEIQILKKTEIDLYFYKERLNQEFQVWRYIDIGMDELRKMKLDVPADAQERSLDKGI